MLTVAVFLSVVFVSLGFIVTPGNAKYLLSGYNMMSEADRAKIDIVSYLKFFNRFHIFLGITLLAGTFALNVFNSNWASVFMVMYPLVAYMFMLVRGNRFYTGTMGQRSATYVSTAILGLIIVGIGALSYLSMKNSELFLTDNAIQIKGVYGMKIARRDIEHFSVVPELPEISSKANGFSGGEFSKGSFNTEDGRKVKLYVNKKSHPFLMIKTSRDEIYFSSDEISAEELYEQIRVWKSQ